MPFGIFMTVVSALLNKYISHSLNLYRIYTLDLKQPYETLGCALGTCFYQVNCDTLLIL